ncbi:MAG: type II toxin-antitoxin system HipA family toxin [Coriobacteriales bacterium]|jgi:serine/threonine-protein kinase HipA|nr:type II toxin-antitoxin system HipA family toxin [Coriobacteriales bacterium]
MPSGLEEIKSLRVMSNATRVGTLAMTRDGLTAFEYDDEWLATGYAISPLSLPLTKRVYVPEHLPFEGVWGVFNDSLPDGWGRLLVDRMLRREHIDPAQVSSIARLAIVGSSGMGALTYEPEFTFDGGGSAEDLDRLSTECLRLLSDEYPDDLDALFTLGGSSGGARPKILVRWKGSDWIIKFPSLLDSAEAGASEYRYAQVASDCGITMPEVNLFPSKIHTGYFGVRRFDRCTLASGETRRVHVASVSALLETSHRIPNLDYQLLMRLCLRITDSFDELEHLYRLMCFNVLAHNRDDHSRNFSFVYDDETAAWALSPAYDLTYSTGPGGEQSTTVNGKGSNIAIADMVELGAAHGLSRRKCGEIAREIEEKTQELVRFPLRQ